MDERFRGEAVGGDGVFTGVGGSVGSDMDRMRPKDAFAGEFCEAKGGGGGPLRAGVAGADLCGSQKFAARSASSPERRLVDSTRARTAAEWA